MIQWYISWWHGNWSCLEVIKIVIVHADSGNTQRWFSHIAGRRRYQTGSRSDARCWHILARRRLMFCKCCRHICRWICWMLHWNVWMNSSWTGSANYQVPAMMLSIINDWETRWIIVTFAGCRYRLMVVLTQVRYRCLWTPWENGKAAVVHVVLQTHQFHIYFTQAYYPVSQRQWCPNTNCHNYNNLSELIILIATYDVRTQDSVLPWDSLEFFVSWSWYSWSWTLVN